MGSIRTFGAAVAIAGVMAGGLGSATLEARKRGGGDPKDAICEYLNAVITYPYVNEYVLAVALQLWAQYGCDTQ